MNYWTQNIPNKPTVWTNICLISKDILSFFSSKTWSIYSPSLSWIKRISCHLSTQSPGWEKSVDYTTRISVTVPLREMSPSHCATPGTKQEQVGAVILPSSRLNILISPVLCVHLYNYMHQTHWEVRIINKKAQMGITHNKPVGVNTNHWLLEAPKRAVVQNKQRQLEDWRFLWAFVGGLKNRHKAIQLQTLCFFFIVWL